ncbi:Pyridoxamine 5'-phosphate oxidase family protein [Arthrobacter sp. 9AX]|uniref:pyridoxamine 5'-phosphate oxidase family protein n=1 Tax=Arthrobacter sp. 9AX TaxID=2653131 RepID=UPI0012EEF67A|nr:pyridoxamine 5'-phosphate oxidase family protein [Arthrobacter sp. 9AX]VXC22447.1 Pyridoxamine 5'-phosphate oxidase family protein [Arthrobacter sp. 9AX]
MDTAATEPETETLGLHECWKHLRSTSLCRIAFTHGDTVEIFPVNYVPSNGTLLVRTGGGPKLEAAAGRQVVSLEADGLNQYGTIAWSVVVKGHAAVVDDTEEIQDAAEAGLSPWQAGAKNSLIRVTPEEVTGRRFVIAPPTHWWAPLEPAEKA